MHPVDTTGPKLALSAQVWERLKEDQAALQGSFGPAITASNLAGSYTEAVTLEVRCPCAVAQALLE